MQNWSGKSKGWNASTTSWKHAFDGQNQPEVNELNSARPLDAFGCVKGLHLHHLTHTRPSLPIPARRRISVTFVAHPSTSLETALGLLVGPVTEVFE